MRKSAARVVRSKSNRSPQDVLRRACRGATPAPFEGLEARRLFAIAQPVGQDYLAFEAEHPEAVFTDLADADTVTWSVISGDAALGNLTAPTGGAAIIANRPAGGAGNDAGSASYPLTLRSGPDVPYFFYARVKYNGGGDNSMYVPADGGPVDAPATVAFDNRNESLGNYHWVSQDAAGVTFDYTNPVAGAETTFKINIREQNYVVDRMVLSEIERSPEELDAISPSTQQVLQATTRSTERNTAVLTFSPVAGADSFNIFQSTSATGPFTQIGTDVTETTFTVPNLTPNTPVFFQVRPVTGGVQGPVSNTASVTAGQGLIGNYFNSGFWGNGTGFGNRPANPFSGPTTEIGGLIAVQREGDVVEFVPQVAFDYGNGSPAPEIGVDNHSTVFVGKVRTNEAGPYQFAGFGDDDTYVFVNGVLVSGDPGGHGIPGSAAEIEFKRTLDLAANTEYDIVVLQSEGGGGSGVFLRYTTPTNPTYTDVPSANLRQTTSLPNAPTGVTRDAASRLGGVEIDFVDASTNELRYELERATDGATFTRVGTTGINGTSLNDQTAVVGETYQYRVVAVNFDGRAESAPVTVTAVAPAETTGASAYYFNSQFWGESTRPPDYQVSVADVAPDFRESVTQINFNYGDGSPKPGVINNDNHSTVFTGKLRVAETGTYQFLAFTDDDSYLWINNQLVSADPGGHGIPATAGEIDFRRPIALTAGQDYNYVLMQSEGGGGSGVILRYSTPGNSSLVDVPASVFVGNIPNAAPDKANGAPADPTGLAVSERGSTRAVITFTDVAANELRYILEKAVDGDFASAETIRLPINSTSYVDNALAENTNYSYRLRAENYFGDSANATLSFRTTAEGAPVVLPAPSDLGARARSTGVLLSFTDNSFFEDGFSIRRQDVAGGPFTEVGTASASPATGSGRGGLVTFEDTGAVAGTTYTYQVVATNAATGNSGPSNSVTVTAGGATGTGLQATYFNERFFSGPGVTLETPVDADENFGDASPDPAIDAETFSGVFEGTFLAETTEAYTFQTASDDGIALRLIDPRTNTVILDSDNIQQLRGLPATGFQDVAGTVNLEAGVRYQIQVRFSENGGGAGYRVGFSTPTLPLAPIPTELLFVPTGTEPVRAPQQARVVGSLGTDRITIEFNENSISETGFQIERGTSATGPFTVVGTTGPDATVFVDNTGGVVANQPIFYRVITLGPGGPSAPATTASFTPAVGGNALTLNGSATYLNGADTTRGTGDDSVRLTDNVNGQTGGAFSTNVQDTVVAGQGTAAGNGFTAQFDFRIPEKTDNPADGFAFVVQRNANNALGGGGGGIGFAGMPNAVAVIFDTFDAANRNETYVSANGEVNDAGFQTGLDFVGGATFRVLLTYNQATNELTQTITNVANPAQTFTRTYTTADGPGTEEPVLDIPAIVGGENAFVGFVGATGGLNQEVQISNFTFNGTTFIPQPGGGATVSEVYVRGSSWRGQDGNAGTTNFMEYLEEKGLGDDVYGYRIFGTGRTAPAQNPEDIIPWINVNQIVVRYTSPPTGAGVPTPGIVLDGQKSDYTVTAVTPVAGDPTAFVLTLDRPLGGGDGVSVAPPASQNGDRVTLSIAGGSAAGSNLSLRINVLQGDVSHAQETTHAVLANDFSEVKNRFFKTTRSTTGTAADYTAFHDVDANGSILANDFSEVKKRFFQNLPAPTTTAAQSAEVASATKDMFSSAAIL